MPKREPRWPAVLSNITLSLQLNHAQARTERTPITPSFFKYVATQPCPSENSSSASVGLNAVSVATQPCPSENCHSPGGRCPQKSVATQPCPSENRLVVELSDIAMGRCNSTMPKRELGVDCYFSIATASLQLNHAQARTFPNSGYASAFRYQVATQPCPSENGYFRETETPSEKGCNSTMPKRELFPPREDRSLKIGCNSTMPKREQAAGYIDETEAKALQLNHAQARTQ